MPASLSESEVRRCIGLISRALSNGALLSDEELYSALHDLLVLGRWPTQHIVTLCSLDRRHHARTTDPGGVDGPPYDRSQATGFSAVDPEVGARALDDDYLGIPPERYPPP